MDADMAVQEEVLTFTSDEEFGNLRDKDETTEIIGFVDEVHAPAVVGKVMKYDLFKFILNNGQSKRIVCLIWGKPLIEKFVGRISAGRVLHIQAGYTKAASTSFYKDAMNIVPFELLIKNETTIDDLGNHEERAAIAQEDQVQDVTFENIGKIEGYIRIEGFLKLKFFKAENKYKPEVYGCGSITDGTYKVNVHITNYTGIEIEKGVRVKILGKVDKSEGGPVTITCRDDNCVMVVPGADTMSPARLVRGSKTPKRGLE